MDIPTCTIIAGPNGAGKTTFALTYLPEIGCEHFVNADMIAAGLSPFSPEREWMAASRLFLREIDRQIAKRQSFAFESTLSGRTYLRLIRKLKADAWAVNLVYLWVPTVELSIARVAERVENGGHHIPRDVIVRRYTRSIQNLLSNYMPLCDFVECLDNSGQEPVVMYTKNEDGFIVHDKQRFALMSSGGQDVRQ